MNTSNETLLDKAIYDYNVATILWGTINTDDEAYLNHIGYFLQQSIEKALKFTLTQNGISYEKTHSIDQLIYIGHKNNIDLHLNEYIEDHAEMFTTWEAKTRYVLGYRIEFYKIEKAISKVGEYINNLKQIKSLGSHNLSNYLDDDYNTDGGGHRGSRPMKR